MKIETAKIPEIIFNVMKNISENADLFKVDVYVHLLSNLTDLEIYYLLTNHSNELYDNDLAFLVDTLQNTLRLYEAEEEYEICQEIFTSIQKYDKIEKNAT